MTTSEGAPRSGRLSVLGMAAVCEVVTGIILLVYPPILARLFFDTGAPGAVAIVSRIAGMALVALGAACWPGRDGAAGRGSALLAMLTYSLLVAVYFTYLGIEHEWVGPLLWPAALLHAALTIPLGRAWLRGRRASAAR